MANLKPRTLILKSSKEEADSIYFLSLITIPSF